MKTMKNILCAALFIAGSAVFAQEKAPKPVFEKQGDLTKGTFYYDDGSIRQEGAYKNGKLHGEWISYNKDGEKTAIAQYKQGQKDGVWFYWSGDKLTQVEYDENNIASVDSWKSDTPLVSNE